MACAQHIQLPTHTCTNAWYECTLTSTHISNSMQTQESLGNMKFSGSHPCCHKQLRMRSLQMFGLGPFLRSYTMRNNCTCSPIEDAFGRGLGAGFGSHNLKFLGMKLPCMWSHLHVCMSCFMVHVPCVSSGGAGIQSLWVCSSGVVGIPSRAAGYFSGGGGMADCRRTMD